MARRLIQLKIEHVAGVDRPANKRRFLIIKSEVSKAYIKEEDGKFCIYDDGEKIGTYDTREAAQAAMRTKKGANMLTKEQIAKITDKDIQEAVMTQLEEMTALEKKVKELEEKVTKGKDDHKKDDDEELWKGVSPAIRNRFEAMAKERDKFAELAKGEKDAREVTNWTQKVASFKYIQITPEHFGKVMKAVAENAEDEAHEIIRVLQSADDLIGKGNLFAEFGKRGDSKNGKSDATNIVARVEAMADDFQKMDQKISRPDAIQKVFTQHPEWYALYRKQEQIAAQGS